MVETAGEIGSEMRLDIGEPLTFVKEVPTSMVGGGTTEKKMKFPKRIKGNLTNQSLKAHVFP